MWDKVKSKRHNQICRPTNVSQLSLYAIPLEDLFKTVQPEVILDFMKAAAQYRLL